MSSVVVPIKKYRPNPAIGHWMNTVEAICEDERVTPDDMAELCAELKNFYNIMRLEPDIRNKLKDHF